MNEEARTNHLIRCGLASGLAGLKYAKAEMKKTGQAPKVGLCHLMSSSREGWHPRSDRLRFEWLKATDFLDWEYHSGVIPFPVPSPRQNDESWRVGGYGSPASWAYMELPLWTGAYGRLRRLLMNHLIRELPGQIIENEVECLHVDTCLSGYWGGHHLPHVQIAVWRGMTIGDVRRGILYELNQGCIMGSTEEARLLQADVVQPEEADLAEFLFEKVCKSVEKLRGNKRRLFTDLEESDDEDSESVYAYFVFTGLECPSYDLP